MNHWSERIIYPASGKLRVALTGLTLASCLAVTGCPEDHVVVYRQPAPVVVYQPAPYYAPAPVYAPAPQPVVVAAPTVSPAALALEPLVAPVALYPDPLLAAVLPAATFPQQLQEAGQFLAANPQPPEGLIEAQNWPPAVKAVVHYPTVIAQLNGDINWTQSLGSAFVNQQPDVMAAVQDLRAQAIVQHNLVSNSQVNVIQDGGVIAIQPASPTQLYVPTYDPVVVYTGYRPLFYEPTFYAVGPWFVTGFDWGGGAIFVGDWHGGYIYGDHGWYRDRAYRYDHFEHWGHDERFGPAPHVERDHYAYANNVRGHEGELRHTMEAHRDNVANRNAQLHNNQYNKDQTLQRNEFRKDQTLERNEVRKNDTLQRNEVRQNDNLQRNEIRQDDTAQRNQIRKDDASARQADKRPAGPGGPNGPKEQKKPNKDEKK
jgi:hypothetical protein